MTSLPNITIQNIGVAQTMVPFTFGQVFAAGHLQPGEGLQADEYPLQVDVKATHPDGSVRHAIVSGILPQLAVGRAASFQLAKAPSLADDTTPIANDISAAVEIKVDGVAYRAALDESKSNTAWLNGLIVHEAFTSISFKTPNGDVHPHLNVKFGVRRYTGAKKARVEFIVENNTTFTPAPQNFTYDVALILDGKTVYEQAALKHYHHARWHQYVWRDAAPAIHVKLDTAYLISTSAVSNYDQRVMPAESLLTGYASVPATKPMQIGPLNPYMPATGGRGDIGPLPEWSAAYLLSMDKRAFDVMMAAADGSGAWSIHYRDEKTTYPVRTDNPENQYVTIHWNLRDQGPLPVPRFANNNDGTLAETPYAPDEAHQPSLAYLPYLVTGDYYYLEELHFWASWNPIGTAPGYSGNGKGLVRWQQVRGQGWSMRTLGHAVYITPDGHPMKEYFTKQLDNNLEFYHQTYVVGNPNELGVYDGSGEGSYEVHNSAPWQDDYFTWSFGYLTELGFEKAKPIFQWKAKYVIGRMTGPGYCWIHAAAYGLETHSVDGAKIKSFAELYARNFPDDWQTDDNGRQIIHPDGLKYSDQPCGSQEQADWRTKAQGFPWPWEKGQMTGYSSSALGYPSNMQPALALAADMGSVAAVAAWKTFDGRAGKPDYNTGGPQFAIIPRTIEAPAIVPVQPPVNPTPNPAPGPSTAMVVVEAPTNGTWQDVGAEGALIDVPKDTIVRYGANDKFVIAKVGGAFTASNAFFGRDPIINVVKRVQKHIAVSKLGKIATPSSTKLIKKSKLIVSLFDPQTLNIVKKFNGVAANSKGIITLSDASISAGVEYGATVSDETGDVLVIQFPMLGS